MEAGSFLLNRELKPRLATSLPADQTVLAYLRENGLKGTKEGCASGDCGACLAVVVSSANGQLIYKPINTCITFLHSLAGHQLVTVEGLTAAADAELHPVQAAMVDNHASQCGFCTPGFVMALFAHFKSKSDFSRQAIEESIAGNLCRCTGYRPIVAAGMQLAKSAGDYYTDQREPIKQRLAQLKRNGMAATENFAFPRTIAELEQAFIRTPSARILAGGTDLALEVTQQVKRIEQLIYIGGVQELSQIVDYGGGWDIGAAVTYEQCIDEIGEELPELRNLLLRFGSRQIRSQATVAGNIANASPIADGPPVFSALGAKLVLNKNGVRRKLEFDDFYRGYKKTALRQGEFIERLLLNKPSPNAIFKIFKISKRIEDDISAVCAVFNIGLKNRKVSWARIAFGGMATTPKRAPLCEKALLDGAWEYATVDLAAQALGKDFTPISDMRASAAYRRQVAANLMRKCYYETAPEYGARKLRVEWHGQH